MAAGSLRELGADLRVLSADSERAIEELARDFEGLAQEIREVVATAGTIVRCAEDDRMALVLPGVEHLSTATKSFLRERLEATAGILETVGAEAGLLERLAQLTRGQRAIVKETGMLRVLTNIEVARLGEVGAGFQYLATELDDFSQAVARSTQELTRHTDERSKAIAETERRLQAELPQMRAEFRRMDESLTSALGEVDGTLGQLCQTPQHFRACIEEIAAQIAGVVAAIQAHDITRQEMEHVWMALGDIAGGMEEDEEAAEMRVGLAIQSYQLRNIRETVRGWMAQIRECLEGIGRIASSEILDLGPVVMAQESALSQQVERIESLEEECEAGNAKVQASLGGIAGLMELVTEHLARSKSVRDRLQLLMFNSIIEASRLGTQADGILEISTTIKGISASWGRITAETEAATGQIRALVDGSRATLEAFSDNSAAPLREARAETMKGLETLRGAAECAERRGREIQAATAALQARIGAIGEAAERLESCFARLEPALGKIDEARAVIGEIDSGSSLDREGVEQRFGARYTTEMERAVMRAALDGGPLPAQQSFAGNSVELF